VPTRGRSAAGIDEMKIVVFFFQPTSIWRSQFERGFELESSASSIQVQHSHANETVIKLAFR
jgi:hypothetical protein